MIAQDHTSAHPSALGACPGVALGFQTPALSLTASALLPAQLPQLGIALACDLPGLGLSGALRPVTGASVGLDHLCLQLHIPQGGALLVPLPWQRVLSAFSPFGQIFNKQHG